MLDRKGVELTPGCQALIIRPCGKREYGWIYFGPINESLAYLVRPYRRGVQVAMTKVDRIERKRLRH